LLVHGAGSGPWIFDSWLDAFPGLDVRAVDLPVAAGASMDDYAAAIATAAARAPGPVAVCGWSMGGLAAMMATRDMQPDHLVLLEPSPPAEIHGYDLTVQLVGGTFDPEEAYGAFPPEIRARPESMLARAERKRGIAVRSLPGRTLVVYGRSFPDDRGRRLAAHYGAEELEFPDLDHWGLILDGRVPRAIASWLGAQHRT
jgi:pimeloyl-ACP methyl ester carboxylesterase